tara:strand:- start:653 stop:940 length:288 start_codon:yes stop_codon:yes gene_type:complete
MKKIWLMYLMVKSINSIAQMAKTELEKLGIISGKVIDEVSKEVLPYINVVVMDMSKKIITGGMTTEDGAFKIKGIPRGNNYIEIQFMGYSIYTTN